MLALATCTLPGALVGAAPGSGSSQSTRPSAVQIVRVSTRGFAWGDAGIGVAAGIGVSMLAVGGGLLIIGTRRPRATTAAEAISPAAGSLLTSTPAAQACVPIDEQEGR